MSYLSYSDVEIVVINPQVNSKKYLSTNSWKYFDQTKNLSWQQMKFAFNCGKIMTLFSVGTILVFELKKIQSSPDI